MGSLLYVVAVGPYNRMAGRIFRISCRWHHPRSACDCTYYHNSKSYPGEKCGLEITGKFQPQSLVAIVNFKKEESRFNKPGNL